MAELHAVMWGGGRGGQRHSSPLSLPHTNLVLLPSSQHLPTLPLFKIAYLRFPPSLSPIGTPCLFHVLIISENSLIQITRSHSPYRHSWLVKCSFCQHFRQRFQPWAYRALRQRRQLPPRFNARVPIASLPGRLPLRVIDRIHDSKSRMRSMKAEWETSGNEATEVVD